MANFQFHRHMKKHIDKNEKYLFSTFIYALKLNLISVSIFLT